MNIMNYYISHVFCYAKAKMFLTNFEIPSGEDPTDKYLDPFP